LRIENAADAKGIVRKYITGTRSRHGKIASITMDEEPKVPDEKGVWTINGSYVTEEGDKEQFTASVTSRGEVLLTIPTKTQNISGDRPLRETRLHSHTNVGEIIRSDDMLNLLHEMNHTPKITFD
jgi:hypothetical protein